MKNRNLKYLFIGGILASLPVFTQAAVFEDFSKTISSNKFTFQSAVERTLELDTVNQNLKLAEKGRGYTQEFRNLWTTLADSTGNMIQADLNLSEATLSGTGTQQAFIGIAGFFYNSNSATPTNSLGDVFVRVSIGDRGNGPEAWYEVQESTATDFSTQNSTIASLGSVSLNTTYTASITYDGNQTFSIVFNNGTAISVTGPARLGDASFPSRRVGSSVRFGQNNSTPSILDDTLPDGGLPVSVAGTVDNVTTDTAGLVDDFSGASLDQGKWNTDEFSKEIVDGALVMKATGQGAQKTEPLWLNKFPVNVFGATVKLLSSSTINNTTQIRARLAHHLSNDTFDVLNGATADGYTGAVWTQFTIRRNLGVNRAFVYAERAQNTDWSASDQLFFIDVTPAAGINLDQDYVLLIEKTGTLVEYKLDGVLVHSFDLATDHQPILSGNVFTPVREAGFDQSAGIQARIQDDAGAVHASFDDIVTELVGPTVTLDAADENGADVALPTEVFVKVGEVITLKAKTTAPDVFYAWTQEAGELVTPARIAHQQVQISSLIGTAQTLSFTVPAGTDAQSLRFKVTVTDQNGVETEQDFELKVDQTVASTLAPTTLPAVPVSGGGGAINPFALIFGYLLFVSLYSRRKI